MCQMVYVCAHDCGGPRTTMHIILRNTIHPLLRHRSSMAWRSPMRLRCLARMSQGSTFPGCTVSGIFFLEGCRWEQNLGLHGCIASFLPTESSPQLYGHTNFKVKQLCSTNSNRYPTPELPCALPRIPFYSPTGQSLTQFLLRQADFTSSRTAWSFCLHALG